MHVYLCEGWGAISLVGKSPRWVIVWGGGGGWIEWEVEILGGKSPRGVIVQGVNGMGVKILGGNSPRG